MSVKVTFDEKSKQVLAKIGEILPITRAGSRQGLYQSGKDLSRTLKSELLKKNKVGRVYLVRLRGRMVRHQSSAPGQTPANLTGNYRKNVNYKVHGDDELIFGVGRDAPYAKSLEDGAPDRNLKARPGLRNSVNENIRNIEKNIEIAMLEAYKAGKK